MIEAEMNFVFQKIYTVSLPSNRTVSVIADVPQTVC
jgi:hypothetical protein